MENMNNRILKYCLIFLLVATTNSSFAQVEGTEKRYVRVGSLQSQFSAYGSERAWNNSYYEGLRWPADYPFQDNAVIKRSWIAVDDFTDEKGEHWEKYGIYFALDYVGQSLFPMELKEIAKFKPPPVYVDGDNLTARYLNDIDKYDPNLIADRVVVNVVNTNIGLTMKREIYAFSQQYHDNYFIKVYTFKNTGNTDYDSDIELHQELKGVRISWGTRYSVCREGAYKIGDGQSWGKHSWVTKRGEDYAQHVGDKITESNPIVNWLRCGFSWAGQSSVNSFDNIGGPDVKGNGRLTAPQFAGTVILHVDKSATDHSDDPNQPAVLGWHAGDTYPKLGDMQNVTPMIQLYSMLSGHPYKGLGGTDRFYESHTKSITDKVDPFTIHNDAGGTNVWISYGPFDIPFGDSVVIVEAQGINGLGRQKCEQIGARWKKAYDSSGDKGPFPLPDGTTTDNRNIYKNTWVYTGMDSILETFGRAKRNFDSGFKIPQPPLPPAMFEIKSGGDKINLKWKASPSEGESNFAGYKIFRAVGKPDTTYDEIFTAPAGVYYYADTSAVRGFSYYYYIVSFTDGSLNSSGETNPTGPLYSSRFYTKTTEPAFLQRQAGKALSDIRIVPNPYNIAAKDLQYPGEKDKIMFLDIPGYCTIKIYTERGDLITTINHNDGSGDETWYSLTDYRQVIVSGVYIAVFETPDGQKAIRKFVIIR